MPCLGGQEGESQPTPWAGAGRQAGKGGLLARRSCTVSLSSPSMVLAHPQGALCVCVTLPHMCLRSRFPLGLGWNIRSMSRFTHSLKGFGGNSLGQAWGSAVKGRGPETHRLYQLVWDSARVL